MAGVSGRKAFSGVSELVLQDGESAELYNFAYGSNMNSEQVRARCTNAKLVAVAKLPDHQLGFFGYSAVWDGAEESVVPAPGQDVWGVIYELSPSDKEQLDDAQDALFDGSGAYFHSPAKVTDQQGKVYSVLLYKKAKLGNPEKPSEEYLNFIVQGAVERGLPSAYVDQLRGMESTKAKFVVPRAKKVRSRSCSRRRMLQLWRRGRAERVNTVIRSTWAPEADPSRSHCYRRCESTRATDAKPAQIVEPMLASCGGNRAVFPLPIPARKMLQTKSGHHELPAHSQARPLLSPDCPGSIGGLRRAVLPGSSPRCRSPSWKPIRFFAGSRCYASPPARRRAGLLAPGALALRRRHPLSSAARPAPARSDLA